jgi:hypothetical protein
MPSIGLALHAGRQMWESERKEKETNDRFLAERKLFDAQLKEQEAAAEYLNQANEQARSAKKSILNNRERILIGDPTGTANVLRDTVYRDFDGKVTVDPTTKEVIIIDKDGKEVGRQQPLMGMDGVAKLMQLGNTIDQTYAANVAAQQTAQQRAYEMTKMREEKGFDYKKAVDVAGIGANATLGAASMGANATLGAAGIKAGADRYKAELEADTRLRAAQMENIEKLDRSKWAQAVSVATGKAPTIDSATNNLILPQMTPEQEVAALNTYTGMTSIQGRLGPRTTIPYTFNEQVVYGNSPTAQNTQGMFDQVIGMPVGVPALTFNTGLSGVQGNPYNNFGFNFGGQQLGAVQLSVDQQAQTAAAAEAARQARVLEQARAYGFIR